MSIRILVVDDQELVRAGFVVLLSSATDVEVVGEASNGAEAVEIARRERPDVVLMDVRMPQVDGIEATRQVTAGVDHPPKVLILTTFDTDEYAYEALEAGACGFLVKDTPPADLLRAVRVAADGGAVIAPSTTRRLLERLVAARPDPAQPTPGALEDLTPREREVLTLIARGGSNREIADHLYISELTAKTHVSRILAKLGLPTRVHAVVFAYETGLVVPGSQ